MVLAVAVPLFWLLPARFRHAFLGLVSCGYLYAHAPGSVLGLLAWLVLFWSLTPRLAPGSNTSRRVLWALILGILGFLAFFKYAAPLVETLSSGSAALQILIPLGISYYTFKLIHYAAEVARGAIVHPSFWQFFCYMMLLPIFTAGPIQRFDHFLANQDHQWNLQTTVEGLTRIVHGLVKAFVFATFLKEQLYQGELPPSSLTGSLVGVDVLQLWGATLVMYLYVYLDFSAYTDIAIGCSRLFGIRIMENFNFPVIATNIRDYWRRWHMSLSGWCQAYVYMPVLGLYRRPMLSLYATFLVIGLWHAGTLNRIGWGMYHATGVAVYTAWNRFRRKQGWVWFDSRPAWLVSLVVTQLFVCGSMSFLILGEEQGLGGSLRILAKLFGLDVSP